MLPDDKNRYNSSNEKLWLRNYEKADDLLTVDSDSFMSLETYLGNSTLLKQGKGPTDNAASHHIEEERQREMKQRKRTRRVNTPVFASA